MKMTPRKIAHLILAVLYLITLGICYHVYQEHQRRESLRIQNKYREVMCVQRLDDGSFRLESCPRGVKVK